MAREFSLPRPPRPPSPPGGEEPERKRLNDEGRGRRMGEGAGDFRARAPEVRQAAAEPRARHREVAPAARAADGLRWAVEPRRVEAPLGLDDGPRRVAAAPPPAGAPRRDAGPRRMRQGGSFARQEVLGDRALPARGGRVAHAAADRAMVPVLPVARQDVETRPRRGVEVQVAPLGLRAPAVGGELARRPARAVCVLPRTSEMDAAEEALSRALLAVIVGVRRAVTTEEVAMALEDVYGLTPGTFSVHCHRPEDFLLFFAERADRDRVLGDGVLASPYFGCCSDLGRGARTRRRAVCAFILRSRSRVCRLTRGAWPRRRRRSLRRLGWSGFTRSPGPVQTWASSGSPPGASTRP